ncbi:hypothetical protein ANCCEY_05416 [Ancylostoma ceylanicum]|uniref:Uncharacterized protein n=2 Tax=Ancylostoma ceylanicum TaxID=53326 RepID=A0A0D6LTW5_9BILA|nr:hypothetical protein ANCCEY_05416 [Ancylostoma ceylanicum]EYC11104.1 hypothetical protein Y032_0052g2221 [Ancylostoma ceylanicum]
MKTAFCLVIAALIYHISFAEGFFTKDMALRAKRTLSGQYNMQTSGGMQAYGSGGQTGLSMSSGSYGGGSSYGGSHGSAGGYGSTGVSSGAMSSSSVSQSATSTGSVCCCVICCWFNIMC